MIEGLREEWPGNGVQVLSVAPGLVRPGFLAKQLGCSLAITPRWGRATIMGKVMAGMVGRT